MHIYTSTNICIHIHVSIFTYIYICMYKNIYGMVQKTWVQS